MVSQWAQRLNEQVITAHAWNSDIPSYWPHSNRSLDPPGKNCGYLVFLKSSSTLQFCIKYAASSWYQSGVKVFSCHLRMYFQEYPSTNQSFYLYNNQSFYIDNRKKSFNFKQRQEQRAKFSHKLGCNSQKKTAGTKEFSWKCGSTKRLVSNFKDLKLKCACTHIKSVSGMCRHLHITGTPLLLLPSKEVPLFFVLYLSAIFKAPQPTEV